MSTPTIGAVVTAFRPAPALLDALTTLIDQVDALVVVNDSPGSGDPVLRGARELGAVGVEHSQNRGIAAALNTGIEEVRRVLPDAAAVLTCDQDSSLAPGYVAELVETWRRARDAGIAVGMVSPAAAGNNRRMAIAERSGEVLVGGEPIQSGLLITTETLDALGAFDESLFIDGVDSDYYLRALDVGLLPVLAPVEIEHQLGRTLPVRLGILRRDVTVAADFRYYYRVRNIVLVGRRHWRRHRRWVLASIGKELRHELITLALVPGRRRRLRLAARGLADGLRGRSGPIPPDLV